MSDVRAGTFWAASLLISLILLALLLIVWHEAGAHRPVDEQLTSQSLVNCALGGLSGDDLQSCAVDTADCPVPPDREVEPPTECTIEGGGLTPAQGRIADDEPVRLPTGVFIQTLEFRSGANVQMTGYIWQRVEAGPNAFDGDARQPEPEQELWIAANGTEVQLGVVFPEQFDTTFELRRDYEWFDGTGTWTVGFYFEAIVRQLFNYTDYPFDSEQVWLRMWPRSVSSNVVLTPDLESYQCANPKQTPRVNNLCTTDADVFGIDNSIALGGFRIEDTFFDYYRANEPLPEAPKNDKRPRGYSTNFGVTGFEQNNYPELRFNFELDRSQTEAYLANLVPLGVAAALVFAVLMTITANERKREDLNLDTAITMAELVGIFIAVLLVHLQLRSQFDGLVYFELFYFLLYLVILGVALNNLLVSIPATGTWRIFTFGDNLIPKIIFWPSLLLVSLIVTRLWLTADVRYVPVF